MHPFGLRSFFVLVSSVLLWHCILGFMDKKSDDKITVSAPAPGASFKPLDQMAVVWTSQLNVGGYVDIFLYNTAGVVETVRANSANSGSLMWTVPVAAAAGADYYVRVIHRARPGISGNSSPFSITSP